MREHMGKAVGISAVGLGLLAFMIAAPSTSPLYGRTTNDADVQQGDPDTTQPNGGASVQTPADQGTPSQQGAQTGLTN